MECVLLWSLRLPARENAKLHYVHLCGLFSLWSQKGLFGPPCAQDWRMAMAETTSNQLPICLGIRHIYGRDNQKCDEKGSKRFGLKRRYNGRVMAREVYFYQCLWVTKSYAKFGCSRTHRTASIHKSFIVLRCMWKEPAPFWPISHCNYNVKLQSGGHSRFVGL